MNKASNTGALQTGWDPWSSASTPMPQSASLEYSEQYRYKLKIMEPQNVQKTKHRDKH